MQKEEMIGVVKDLFANTDEVYQDELLWHLSHRILTMGVQRRMDIAMMRECFMDLILCGNPDLQAQQFRALVWVEGNAVFIANQLGFKHVHRWHSMIALHLVDIMEKGTPTGFLEPIYKKFLADISAPELTNQEG